MSGSPPQVRWWVNQGETFRQEREGGYVWAPQVTKAGIAVGHHTAVRRVRSGDRVVHYSKGHIRAVSTATTDGYEAPRPDDLPDEAWQREGLRADAAYVDLDRPIPLGSIPEALRSGAGGPFNSNGGVNQGYLFEVPEGVARVLDTLLPVTASRRAWVVYVGQASEANMNFSLPEGRWGWKRRQPNYDQLQPGDLIVFGTGYTDGSPRRSAEDWAQHGLGRVAIARATTHVYESEEPYWPDEGDELLYPIRVDLELERDHQEFSFIELDKRLGGPVGEGMRMSAINQGRAELVALDRLPESTEVTQPAAFGEVVERFSEDLRAAGLNYGSRHEDFVRSFIVSLATKPFVILTGLSGSGKTRLAQAFGDWIGECRVVPVRPDWTSPDSLFGFENVLSQPVDGRYEWSVPDTLEFVTSALAEPNVPHVLVLDEMNLAHVERYFADVLSGMESGEPVVPALEKVDGAMRRVSESGLVTLPTNLFVVGTVNVDETTYMFSPKVLDRANTLEFRVETEDLETVTKPSRVDRASSELRDGFLSAAFDDAPPLAPAFADWMRKVHSLLAAFEREFGHRTFHESIRFQALLAAAGESDPLAALDRQVAQKVLPRLHGSRRELTDLLNALGALCMFGPDESASSGFDVADASSDQREPVLPVSFSKVRRMARRLRDNHFVSFAE